MSRPLRVLFSPPAVILTSRLLPCVCALLSTHFVTAPLRLLVSRIECPIYGAHSVIIGADIVTHFVEMMSKNLGPLTIER